MDLSIIERLPKINNPRKGKLRDFPLSENEIKSNELELAKAAFNSFDIESTCKSSKKRHFVYIKS